MCVRARALAFTCINVFLLALVYVCLFIEIEFQRLFAALKGQLCKKEVFGSNFERSNEKNTLFFIFKVLLILVLQKFEYSQQWNTKKITKIFGVE